MLWRFFGSRPKLSLVTALVLVHFDQSKSFARCFGLQGFSENLLLQLAVSVQEVEGVLDEPSELKTKAAFVLHFRYTFALQNLERLQLWCSPAVVPSTPA